MALDKLEKTVPVYTFILKIASRCNLNCTYCFIYNQDDHTWKNQPKYMSQDVLTKTIDRIVEHCRLHNQNEFHVVLHGGEPLLVGTSYIENLCSLFRDKLKNTGINCWVSIQSNGLLFNESLGDILIENNISLGISIDGPPEINNKYRIYHNGKGSSCDLEKVLQKLKCSPYNKIFSGFLVVIDVQSNPIELFNYLVQFNPKSVDFLLPYDNWDRTPPSKESFDSTEYGQWLIKLFDYWISENSQIKIKSFDSYLQVVLGGSSSLESIGLNPVDLIVIETNGDIEAVDSLKATFHGATKLNLNVTKNTIDDALKKVLVKSRMEGTSSLSEICKKCSIVDFCGGGYIPNRYSIVNGFDNPSYYCNDLKLLINHIYKFTDEYIKKHLAV